MKPKPYNIELHIEELVLHGFSPNDRHAIGEAVQRELTRLFAEQLQYPLTDRGNEENLTSPPAAPSVDDSNRTAPNASSVLALGRDFEVERVDGGSFNVKQGAKAGAIGTQVAQAVFGGLGK